MAMSMMDVCLSVLLGIFLLNRAQSTPLVPRLPEECYSQPGDVNLGLLATMANAGSDNGELCKEDLFRYAFVLYQHIEGFIYAIKSINTVDGLLGNISLGFTIMDACNRDLASLAKTVYMMPDTDNLRYSPGNHERIPFTNCSEGMKSFPVVGIVGPESSRQSVMVASLASVFEVPVISASATSDELSDKSRFEYFLRMTPPDKHRVEVILQFMAHFRWSYFSVVYEEGSYGENAAKMVFRVAKRRKFCIAVFEMILADATDENIEETAQKLISHPKARAVIILLSSTQRGVLFKFLEKQGYVGQFVWLSTQTITPSDYPVGDGSLTLTTVNKRHIPFENYFRKITPSTRMTNPWVRKLWEATYKCLWNAGPEQRSCGRYRNKPLPFFHPSLTTSAYMDAVYAFAHALHETITTSCPSAFIDVSNVAGCLSGRKILENLLNLSFSGYNGQIEFDKHGDRLGKFTFHQYVHHGGDYVRVATFDQQTGVLDIDEGSINWTVFNSFPHQDSDSRPQSVCSHSCSSMEYKVLQDLPCCWDCRRCRQNERLVNNNTGCALCPALTWPDDETLTRCAPISPSHLSWSDTTTILLVISSTCGGISVVGIAIWFVRHRHAKLIKASSRELSSVIVFGTLVAFLTSFCLVLKPNDLLCAISRVGFNMAVSFIYAPLLVKTNRIHRIFSAGKRGTQRLRFISNRSQMIITGILISIQVRTHYLTFYRRVII